MVNSAEVKKDFIKDRNAIFTDAELAKDAFKFCISYSLLVEEYIFKIFEGQRYNFAIASVGSFSRRELSPNSDIDLMFIVESVEGNEEEIQKCVQSLWDCGIEASHTVRDNLDIKKYLKEDLHAFTQFYETRFLIGDEKTYYKWQKNIFDCLDEKNLRALIMQFFEDTKLRYNKYGGSCKMLEPNIKYSAGGLRDLQAVEWMYSIKNKIFLTSQNEITQTENFFNILRNSEQASPRECKRVLESYKFILNVRNHLQLLTKQKSDRLEFSAQEKIAQHLNYKGNDGVLVFMKSYFDASNIIGRFFKTLARRIEEEISNPLSEFLAIQLDEDFFLKGSMLSIVKNRLLSLSDILRVFYYRGVHNAKFDENLRSLVIDSTEFLVEKESDELESSVFFREILRLPKNVGETLFHMNELGVLNLVLPEFRDLNGFFQSGVYHNYTADEHTIVAIMNVEKLSGQETQLGKLYTVLKEKEILFLAILFHDIAKPISLSGHEILGAEIAASEMYRLGYDDEEVSIVKFLVSNHLVMEQVAFRRNLNDPETLNNFFTKFSSVKELDLLYLLTFSDLSAVNPVVWTEWKNNLLEELYRKTRSMLEEQISGEELLYSSIIKFPIAVSEMDASLQDHIDSINDMSYTQVFTEEEIALHLEEIEKGSEVSVFFKEVSSFTNITIIANDAPMLLSKLCGVLSINDLNIHDARIFTRKDGIVIDSFAVTDFRTHNLVEHERYKKIELNMKSVIEGSLQLTQELSRLKSKWWRIENKFFKRAGKVKVVFEEHEKFSILDIFSPDRLGLLYQITRKMGELGLSIFFAKISTRADDVVDSFYLLDRNNRKISPNDYEFIKTELTEAIEQIL
jgi:[protein-PII] uridylyltransferase